MSRRRSYGTGDPSAYQLRDHHRRITKIEKTLHYKIQPLLEQLKSEVDFLTDSIKAVVSEEE